MPVVLAEGLSKVYKYHYKEPGLRGSLQSLLRRKTQERHAVEDVRFAIEAGEVVGFLGPNGAGKTTTLKMLCGLLYPTAGSASVLGHVPARREAEFLRRIALVMGQKNMLWWDVPTMETLLLHKDMYELRDQDFHSTLNELSEMLDVTDLLKVQVRKLSLGERMKMELLAALIHRPEVLFLDEPTIGLDVVSQQRVREFLRTLNLERGTTILLTSHYMEDIEALCPRVLVIDSGRIGYDGSLEALVQRVAPQKRLSAVFGAPLPGGAVEAALSGLAPRLSEDSLKVELSVPREEVAEAAAALLRLGTVADLNVEEAPVEEIIRRLFEGTAQQVRP